MKRTVKTKFAFNGLPKGITFSYDPETDEKILKLIDSGVLEDVSPVNIKTIVFDMPSIESSEKVGEIGGEGADQPSEGGGEGPEALDSPGAEDVQGHKGTRAKVAKGR